MVSVVMMAATVAKATMTAMAKTAVTTVAAADAVATTTHSVSTTPRLLYDALRGSLRFSERNGACCLRCGEHREHTADGGRRHQYSFHRRVSLRFRLR